MTCGTEHNLQNWQNTDIPAQMTIHTRRWKATVWNQEPSISLTSRNRTVWFQHVMYHFLQNRSSNCPKGKVNFLASQVGKVLTPSMICPSQGLSFTDFSWTLQTGSGPCWAVQFRSDDEASDEQALSTDVLLVRGGPRAFHHASTPSSSTRHMGTRHVSSCQQYNTALSQEEGRGATALKELTLSPSFSSLSPSFSFFPSFLHSFFPPSLPCRNTF